MILMTKVTNSLGRLGVLGYMMSIFFFFLVRKGVRECNGSQNSDGRIIGFVGGYPLIFIIVTI